MRAKEEVAEVPVKRRTRKTVPKEDTEAPVRRRTRKVVPKVDLEKLAGVYPPPADPEKSEFVDERPAYYRLMAKAIWLKCSECVCGRATLTDAGYAVPKCSKLACSLHAYRGEIFKEEVRCGRLAGSSDESPRPGDAGEGAGKTRKRAAVRKAAHTGDNEAGGPGLSVGPGPEEGAGVPGAPAPVVRKSRKRTLGGDQLPGGGGVVHRKPKQGE